MSLERTRARTLPRRDVQGLRAVAVLAVVANHVWGYPSGGFVGVDVFFVLSGFLITGLLLRERERDGRISFAKFYRRRFRRIVPAASLVIAVTVAATFFAYNDLRGTAAAQDGLWALAFSANWHFASVGTDYFRNDGLLSPLQHYWSLSVEEQFYVVWPLIILAVYSIARRGARNDRLTLAVIAAALTTGSFTYSLWHTSQEPIRAYFSTVDRGWELGVGALIAVLSPYLMAIGPRVAGFLGVSGLIGIAASLLTIGETSTFPAPWAALPVLSTGLVLVAGLSHDQTYLRPIVNPVAGYIGDISYSIYLWHFPVIIVLRAFYPEHGAEYYALVILATAVLSVLSYHLVEDPIRRSDWLEPGILARRRARRERSPFLKDRLPANVQNIVLGCLVLTCVVAISLALKPVPTPEPTRFEKLQIDPAGQAAPAAGTPEANGSPVSPALRSQQDAVIDALQATDFPDLDPPLEDLGLENWVDRLNRDGCANVDAASLGECSFSGEGANRTAVVLGDSYAMAWMPGIRKALVPQGFTVQQITMGQCPVWNAPVKADGGRFVACEKHREFAIQQTQRMKPELLVLASSQNDLDNLFSESTGVAARDEVQAGLSDTLQKLAGAAHRTVVLAPPPNAGSLEVCLTRGAVPDDCVASVGEAWLLMADAEHTAADAARVVYVDTSTWFCAAGLCPAFTGTRPIRADDSHLTWEYSEQLAPLLAEALRSDPQGA